MWRSQWLTNSEKRKKKKYSKSCITVQLRFVKSWVSHRYELLWPSRNLDGWDAKTFLLVLAKYRSSRSFGCILWEQIRFESISIGPLSQKNDYFSTKFNGQQRRTFTHVVVPDKVKKYSSSSYSRICHPTFASHSVDINFKIFSPLALAVLFEFRVVSVPLG